MKKTELSRLYMWCGDFSFSVDTDSGYCLYLFADANGDSSLIILMLNY